jgi:periplasmic copper chaperone A
MKLLATYLSLMLVAGLQCAHAAPPAITVSDAWVRVVPGSDVAAAYFTVTNGGQQPVAVVGVISPLATSAMIHESTLTGTQSAMRPRAQVPIAAHATIQFTPGGMHVMLMGVKQPLKPGDPVPLVLLLEGGATVAFAAPVRALSEP